jgi:serine phosphatase RsbU (regulator of sigma subunit)
LLVSDGVLELKSQDTHRARRAELSDITRQARDLDTVLARLGLDESTAFSDDVALLFIRREEPDA